MHPIVPQIVGILAVALFLASYQLKRRRAIILLNATSRAMYVLQYLLLGALEGAVLDLLGIASAFFAGKKQSPRFQKIAKWMMIATTAAIIVAGILLYQNFFSLFALGGILLESIALWLTNERYIRLISLFAAPFWLTYNLASYALGSAIGNALTIASIIIAMIKYQDFRRSKRA